MKLKGYILIKENSFAIPVYSDGESFYFHNIDNSLNIVGFEKKIIDKSFIKTLYLSKKFNHGDKAAIVFVGFDNLVFFNSAEIIVDEIINYLEDSTDKEQFKFIKLESQELKIALSNSERVQYEFIIDDELNSIEIQPTSGTEIVKYSLEEYMKMEDLHSQNKLLFDIKDSIIKKRGVKNQSQVNDTYKDVIFSLFQDYLSDNKTVFEHIIIDSNIGNSFYCYLNEKNNSLTPLELTIEEALKHRVDERRRKMRDFNYQFHNNDSIIKAYEKEPAYKRLGIDISMNADILSKIVWSFDTEITKKTNSETEREKISTGKNSR